MPKSFLVGGLLLLFGGVLAAWWQMSDRIVLPQGETDTETIFVDPTGQVVDVSSSDATQAVPGRGAALTERVIMVTDGVRHSVPLAEIKGGGPPKDGIPSIDDPRFVSISDADFIDDIDPGIAVSLNGVDRFYPFQILVWHELVNDTIGGKRVLVSYCPLCQSAVVFDPTVQGTAVEFGTSGQLWQSNLVMYDRQTDSLWSQILGEAIVGEQTGSRLSLIASDQLRFGDWKEAHPNGEVLSRDTGASLSYGADDPYGDYYTNNELLISPVSNTDTRLESKEYVLGLVIDDQAKAYYPPAVQERGEIVDMFAGKTIVVRYDESLDVVRVFERDAEGALTRLNPLGSFWFSWAAAHPETELYK